MKTSLKQIYLEDVDEASFTNVYANHTHQRGWWGESQLSGLRSQSTVMFLLSQWVIMLFLKEPGWWEPDAPFAFAGVRKRKHV